MRPRQAQYIKYNYGVCNMSDLKKKLILIAAIAAAVILVIIVYNVITYISTASLLRLTETWSTDMLQEWGILP